MTQTKIKLCGFKTIDDVRAASQLPIDAIGFILVPGRKRTVSAKSLPALVESVPAAVDSVGVFLNPTQQEVSRWLEQAPLTAIQLHGNESPDLCAWIKERYSVKVIKTFHPTQHPDVQQMREYRSVIDLALLDHARGGTGTSYNWRMIPPYQAIFRDMGLPLWIAGGLTPENVEELIELTEPDGIDVSSGIEQDGKKDVLKMKTLVKRVKKDGYK